MKTKKSRQRSLPFKTWGGRRKNAGRKPRGPRREGPSHRRRERLNGRDPVHVTLRAAELKINFRDPLVFPTIRELLSKGSERFGIRLVEFSVQKNHLHLIVEAPDWKSLARATKGLQIRIARAINKILRRKGRVFAHRYDTHVLKTPREVRGALVYVLGNARKHARENGVQLPRRWIDPCSSAKWFRGWKDGRWVVEEPKPVAHAQTWLLTTGWKRRGLLDLHEEPTAKRRTVRRPR